MRTLSLHFGSSRAAASGTLALITCLLVGCGGLTQVQDSVTKFNEGTHATATAEETFIRAVQTADCTKAFYGSSAQWALGTAANFDLSGTCTPTILDDSQIAHRIALMEAISLYADKMAALATSDNDKSLDANSQKLATNLKGLASETGFSSTFKVEAGVAAAITEIAKMALDQRTFSDIKQAAREMSPHLEALVSSLQAENIFFAEGIASKLDGIELQVRQVIVTAHKDRGPMSFFDVVQAREIVRSANPFSPTPLAATHAMVSTNSDPHNVALQLNSTLDAVVNANQAIANTGVGGISAAASNLIARARDAESIMTAINK